MNDLVEQLKTIIDGYDDTRSLSDRVAAMVKQLPPRDPYVPKCYSYIEAGYSFRGRVTAFLYTNRLDLYELHHFLTTKRYIDPKFFGVDDYSLVYHPELKLYRSEWVVPYRLFRSRQEIFSCNSIDHFIASIYEICRNGMYNQWFNDTDFSSDLASMNAIVKFEPGTINICSDRTDDEFNHLWTMMKLRWE